MNTRQEFDAWYSDGGQAPRSIEKNDLGNYLLSNTYLAWMTWQAATARQEAKVKALVEAFEGVAMMARCGQLDKFIGEPWLNAVHKALAAAKEQA